MTEADLRALGITRVPIPVPFPQAGGPVNVYLLEEPGGVTMFDSGLGTAEAQEALARGFQAAGRRFDEVTRIVLSHGHVDHFGAAQSIIERAGKAIPVYAHPADVAKVAATGTRFRDLLPRYGAYLLKLGVPADVLAHLTSQVSGGLAMARRVDDVRPLQPGDVLQLTHLRLEVVHMPGHTPGLCCLYDRQRRLFFSADHLLEKVSPNPVIELGPAGEEGGFRPLIAYLDSIARLRALDVELVLPGHGAPFGDHRKVIDGLLGFYAKRQGKIRDALAAGPLTGYQIVQALFPGDLRPGDLFLVVSEVIANVEVLEAAGQVRRELDGSVYRFSLAA
jgi:glyoxylase-like metal-dependent hydrolase (beta-lactamase superfamily II)